MSLSKVRFLLFPFSLIYGIIVWFRNVLFNSEILPSESFDMPIISIGNITVGGTGKTPHTEYLMKLLGKDYQVAVLSRGYKRKSKGFLVADSRSQLSDLGDEPLQMKRKFPEVVVAVDENRRRGIHHLMDKLKKPFIDVILLDDAFQHQYVNPSISILLIDYNRMLCDDFLLPVGNLREPAGQSKRADIVIISKCPNTLMPIDLRIVSKKIKLYSHQVLYYTNMQYGSLKAMSSSLSQADKKQVLGEESTEMAGNIEEKVAAVELSMEQIKKDKLPVLILAGIAAPESLVNYVRNYSPDAQSLLFADHHEFTKKDARNIGLAFEKIKSSGGIIISTEKDAMRIQNNPFLEAFIPYIYYPVLYVHFLEEQGISFEQKILDYVRINRRNRGLA